jgi:hypothetical protein
MAGGKECETELVMGDVQKPPRSIPALSLQCLAEPAVIVTMHKEPIILQAPNKPCPPGKFQD